MPISDSVCKALVPGAGRFTLANLVLGLISIKFQNWTYAQDTVLFCTVSHSGGFSIPYAWNYGQESSLLFPDPHWLKLP